MGGREGGSREEMGVSGQSVWGESRDGREGRKDKGREREPHCAVLDRFTGVHVCISVPPSSALQCEDSDIRGSSCHKTFHHPHSHHLLHQTRERWGDGGMGGGGCVTTGTDAMSQRCPD